MQDFKPTYLKLIAPLYQTEESFERFRVLVSRNHTEIFRIYEEIKKNLENIIGTYYDPDRPKPKAPLIEKFVYIWCENPSQSQPVSVEDIKKVEKQIKCRIHKLLVKQYAKYGIPKIKPDLAKTLSDMNSPLFPIARLYDLDEIVETTKQLKALFKQDEQFFAFADDGKGNSFAMLPYDGTASVYLYQPEEKKSVFAGNLSRKVVHDDDAFEWLSQYTELRKPIPSLENFEKLDEPLKNLKELVKAMQQDQHYERYRKLFSEFSDALTQLTSAYTESKTLMKAA